ncbi:Kelch repeat-containing protein [Algoriphagus mannitolivorans]|uniref:Kelch repeat-containing protein n=1 Tax=Algoriphagus mannitolivorans TaxID=226504 RepID=UPI000400E05F|nr:hypothetical protein [Algoriphagus mannitolivorans]
MRTFSALIFLSIAMLFSCEQEEFITQREYPFVNSIGVSDVDPSGATINFEILKNGASSVEEYGVEFIEADFLKSYTQKANFQTISQSGQPQEGTISLRISRDLIIPSSYLAKPFVRVGNTKIYGEGLVFDSQGVNPPLIKEVFPKEIYLFDRITVLGDFFNSRKEFNQVEIVGLENDYRITIDSVSNQKIQFSVELRNNDFGYRDQKYDLKITSGGKSTVVPQVFSLTIPKITQVNPLRLYVGDAIQVQLSRSINLAEHSFNLNYGQNNFTPLFPVQELSPGTYQGILNSSLPSGLYPLSLNSTRYSDRFPEMVEVLPTWQLFQQGIQFPDLNEKRVLANGDQLLIFDGFSGASGTFSSFDLGTNSPRPLAPKPGGTIIRSGSLGVVAEGRYFYFGLGSQFEAGVSTYWKDFYRYDLTLGEWERLADFPFEFTGVVKSFSYQGKIYAIMGSYLNFRVYDPQTNEWSLSPIPVPSQLRNAYAQVLVGDYWYYISSNTPVTVSRYKLGGVEEVYSVIGGQFSFGQSDIAYWDGNLILFNNGTPTLRMEVSSKKTSVLQWNYESLFSSFFPWPTSQGLLMAFPKNKNTYVQEGKIYKLIQDF